MTDEEKLQAYEDAGRIVSDNPKPKVEEEEEKPVVPPPADPTPSPLVKKEEKKEDTPPNPGADTPPVIPADAPPSVPNDRPRTAKYIPLDKYQEEKRERDAREQKLSDELAVAQTKIKEFEGLKPPAAGDVNADEAITEFAEKYAMEPEDVKKLLNTLPRGETIPPEMKEEYERIKHDKLLREEEQFFEKEWSGVEPVLKAEFPNATAEQLKAARQKLDELGHTPEHVAHSLDYVLFKNKSDIADLFKAPEEAPKGRKTVEGGRVTNNSSNGLSAKDFKGKTSFDEFYDMEQSQINSIIEGMDRKTYADYVTWCGKIQQGGDGLVVNRGGQKVTLK